MVTSTFTCPTHGDFSKTTNGKDAPKNQQCPTCGARSPIKA